MFCDPQVRQDHRDSVASLGPLEPRVSRVNQDSQALQDHPVLLVQ